MSTRMMRGVALAMGSSVLLMSSFAAAGEGNLAAPVPGSGEDFGRATLGVNFRFPPNATQIAQVKTGLRMASRILCDTTEGKVRIKQVTLSAGAAAEKAADVWLWDDSAKPRSFSPGLALRDSSGAFTNATGFTQGSGFHANVWYPNLLDYGGTVFAHELMHYMFTVSDEYAEAFDTPCGQGDALDQPYSTQPGEDYTAAMMDETVNTLAQRNPAPVCQTLSGGVWSSSTTLCFEDKNCAAGQRCFVKWASELQMSTQYFDLVHGADNLTDCPAPRASSVVYLSDPALWSIWLGDGTAANTDDFATKTYAEAAAAAAMTIETEVIDDTGIYNRRYDRASHQLMFYYQKRSADLWRVWLGFDANKLAGSTPSGAPRLSIVGSFDLQIVRGTPGCGDGVVQTSLGEECDALPGAAAPTAECKATLNPSSTAVSGTAACNLTTCTWNRSTCIFSDTPTLLPGVYEKCGDGILQTTAPLFPSNRYEQCETNSAPTGTCARRDGRQDASRGRQGGG